MGTILNIIFLGIFAMLMLTQAEQLQELLIVNGIVQLTLFVLVACIPFLKTGRMSFVDIAWPFGVALIGLQILLFTELDLRSAIVAGVYLFIGLRMGLGAVVMGLKTGVIFKTEFPRYEYRREMMKKSGEQNMKLHMLLEVLAQGFANASVLALPGFMIALNPADTISSLEVAGLVLWAVAYTLESIADTQKLAFIAKNPKGVCNVGLWKYSRHPNYFSEWLVWTGLVIAAIPSWLALQGTDPLWLWVVMGIGAALASVMLYTTLVYLTGAKPAEYFSVRKRAEYAEYQKKTNMFFPWFPKS